MALPAVRSSGSVGRWDPLREFEDLYSRLGQWMDSMTGTVEEGRRAWSPLADIAETDGAYLVDVELPGVKREDVTVDLTGRELTINGERKEKERQGWFRHRTRRTGQFHYSVTLPHDVDADRIDATLADGILTVRAPKSDAAKPRRITVTGA
ncbi:Hsp20/alpha crystallin family protein [Qaidamihabitans albus]|uniref:Hsp20/alpha crystallin family protein n=1 Tax=Qaidamihabitans albus TaxID=2795733 RepID=UPI0018F13323|nr:Hsp20/alpha crystallin family protein [Qaidamihabitans albus]